MGDSSETVGETTTPLKRPHSKILVDGGDPEETTRIRQLIGFVDKASPQRLFPRARYARYSHSN